MFVKRVEAKAEEIVDWISEMWLHWNNRDLSEEFGYLSGFGVMYLLCVMVAPTGKEGKTQRSSPIRPPLLLPLSTKTCQYNLDLDTRPLIIPCTCPTTSSSSLSRARDCADYFCVAHFKVGRAVGGGLGAYLCTDAAELVPPSAIQAKERKGVG